MRPLAAEAVRRAPDFYARARTVEVYPGGPYAAPVTVLHPASVGDLTGHCLAALGIVGAEDLDGRRLMAARHDGRWHVLAASHTGRQERPALAAVRVVVESLPAPPDDLRGAARLDAARRHTQALSDANGPSWPYWHTRAADEALEVLHGDYPTILAEDAVPAGAGPRPSTVAARDLAQEHLRTFLEYLPEGRLRRPEIKLQYLASARRTGVARAHLAGVKELHDRIRAIARFWRVGALGELVQRTDRPQGEPAEPLPEETRSALLDYLARRARP